MKPETKKGKPRLELLKSIGRLVGQTLLVVLTTAVGVTYFRTGEQPSNFTLLITLLLAIILNGKKK